MKKSDSNQLVLAMASILGQPLGKCLVLPCAVLLIIVTTGCATRQASVKVGSDQVVQIGSEASLGSLKVWCMTGRTAAKYADTGWQARLRWCRDDERTCLELTGPLNMGSAIIRHSPGVLWVQESKELLTISHSPERLLASRLGFSVPLAALKFWLLGVAKPGTEVLQQFDDDGRLSKLRQSGWVVDYSDYALFDGYYLPEKIKLSNEAGTVTLKIVVDKWVLGK